MAAIAEPTVPVGPSLSIYDPIFLGIDEYGEPVYLDLMGHNLLAAGEPGAGKSALLNNITGTASVCTDTRLVLFDGKRVELGKFRHVADEFVGPDLDHAIHTLERLQLVVNNRYEWLAAQDLEQIAPGQGMDVIVVVIDEIAYFSATVGTKAEQDRFTSLFRDLVARGRACGMPVVAATQRPSFDIIPTSLRDLFAYRCAFRCTTSNSSNIILGQGWAEAGFSAHTISPTNRGAALLLAETGVPRLIKCAFLTREQILDLANYAAWIRRPETVRTNGFGLIA